MATFAGLAQSAYKHLWPYGCIVIFFSYLCIASPTHGHRLICWQAILNCQSEPECFYAYEQYLHACDPILTGQEKQCPSHCISSLVQLNLTRNGPALEDCSCETDDRCRKTKRAIEPCLPKTRSMGCTAARRQCNKDSECREAVGDYLLHCGKLFSGAVCTKACRNVIARMRKIPKAQSLDTCVCDGNERTICEFIKVNMKILCVDQPPTDDEGSGNDYSDDEDFTEDPPRVVRIESGCAHIVPSVLTLVASILVLLPFL